MIYDGSIIERGGRRFRINLEPDQDSGPPWENDDGGGIVSDWTSRDKRPGERVLNQDSRYSRRYYDFAATVKRARKDGWDSEPYGTGTKGERAARAVEQNFKFYRGWCNNQWQYVGVCVTDVTDDENAETDYVHAVWGCESNYDEGLETYANEFIDEILREVAEAAAKEQHEAQEAAAKEQHEAQEAAYWADRDVITK